MSRLSRWVCAIALAAGASAVSADTILLKDGRSLDGLLTRQGDDMVVQTTDGRRVTIQVDQIKKVMLNSAQTPEEKASSAWTRAQAEIKNSDDLDKIIALHEPILKDFSGTPTAEAVRQSLALYKQMKSEHWIYFRGQWMSAVKAEVRQRQAVETVMVAEVFLRAGKLKDALQKIDDALEADDQNAQALALGGLMAYRQNNLTAARSYFERLAAADDGSVLAHNNLAVIAFQQNSQVEGLVQLGKALQAAPEHRLVLDNIAAALLRYSGPQDIKPLTDLLRQYTQAETKMEAVMAQQGLFRYAATWASADQKEKFSAAIEQVKTRMAQLDDQYGTAVANLAATEQGLRDTAAAYDNAIADYNTSSLVVLAGIGSRGGYVDPYWYARRETTLSELDALARQHATLETQRGALAAAIRQMRGDAARLKADLGKAEAVNSKSVIRLMEAGDVLNPPPPAAIQLPVFPAAAPAAGAVVPAHVRLNLVSDPASS